MGGGDKKVTSNKCSVLFAQPTHKCISHGQHRYRPKMYVRAFLLHLLNHAAATRRQFCSLCRPHSAFPVHCNGRMRYHDFHMSGSPVLSNKKMPAVPLRHRKRPRLVVTGELGYKQSKLFFLCSTGELVWQASIKAQYFSALRMVGHPFTPFPRLQATPPLSPTMPLLPACVRGWRQR